MKLSFLTLFLYVFLLLFQNVASTFKRVNFTMQSYTAEVLYEDSISNGYFRATRLDSVNRMLYLVQVISVSVTLQTNILCTPVISVDILIGPPSLPYRSTTTLQEAIDQKTLFETVFFLSPDSSDCRSRGGNENTCFGPLWVGSNGINRPVPLTNETLLRSTGVSAISRYGPGGSGYAVTWIDIKLPGLVVSTNSCLDDAGETFSGTFAISENDNLNRMDLVQSFKRLETQLYHRLTFRTDYYTNEIFLHLETADGTNDYTRHYRSVLPMASAWENNLPMINLQLTKDNGELGNCTANVTLNSVPASPQLNDRVTPTITNYKDVLPLYFEKTRVCNWAGPCGLTTTGELQTPNCPVGSYMGGSDLSLVDENANIRLQVEPDASYNSYIEECDSFYPWGDHFYAYNILNPTQPGPRIQRSSGRTCFGPFYNPDAVTSARVNTFTDSVSQIDEMGKQCAKMGGKLIGDAYCMRQSDDRKCESLDWIYFDEWCYRKFNYLKDGDFRVPDSQSATTCARLGADVTTAVATLGDPDLSSWLRANFVGYLYDVPGYNYRVLISGKSCECYDWQFGQDGTPTYDLNTCNCEKAAFPLCRYPFRSRVPPHYWVAMSPETHTVRRQGQFGIPWTGQPTRCKCLPGWTGIACQDPTCPSYIDVNDPTRNVTTVEIVFYAVCYVNGACENHNRLECACGDNFGPPGSLNPASVNYRHRCESCLCPMSVVTAENRNLNSGYVINGVLYSDGPYYPICGGRNQGSCVLGADNSLLNSTGVCATSAFSGYCECRTRIVPRSFSASGTSAAKIEPAYNGKTCDARVAVIPADGYRVNMVIQTGFCNGLGTACSSGEIQRNVKFDGMDSSLYWQTVCYDRAGNPVNGCICDNGITGDSCTCPTNFDVVFGLVVYTRSSGHESYVQLRQPLVIRQVEINVVPFYDALNSAVGCTVTYVRVGQSLTSTYTECAFVLGNLWSTEDHFVCPDSAGEIVFVMVGTVESAGECDIAAFQTNDYPCGNNTNNRAAAFFRNERNQGPENYVIETQTVRFGYYGCTNFECMCDSDHEGPNCGTKVSSKRVDPDSSVYLTTVCGSTTFPPRGNYDPVAKKCVCARYNNLRFSGDACEVAEIYVVETGTFEACAGNGVPVYSSFPYGICGYDKYDRDNDVLSTTPYSDYSPLRSDLNYTVNQVRQTSRWDRPQTDRRAIVSISGETWLFPAGSTFSILSNSTLNMDGNISVAGPNAPTPLSVYLQCDDTSAGAVRGIWNISIWKLENTCSGGVNCFVTTQTYAECDVLDYTSTYACSVHNFCRSSWLTSGQILASDFDDLEWNNALTTCIADFEVYENDQESYDILTTGQYDNIHFIFADLSKTDETTTETTVVNIPTLDCTKPVDRILNDAAVAYGDSDQCPGMAIGRYSDALGLGYGLFYNAIPDLPFVRDEDFQVENAAFVASLLGNKICINSKGEIQDIFDHVLWEEIILDLLLSDQTPFSTVISGTPESILDTTLVLDHLTEEPGNYDYQGKYGSRTLDKYGLLDQSLLALNWTWDIRPGYTAVIPTTPNRDISNLQITLPFDLAGLQVIGSSGRACGTVLRPMKQGEVLNFNCFNTLNVNTDSVMIQIFTKAVDGQNITEIAQEWVQETINYNVIRYYFDDEDLLSQQHEKTTVTTANRTFQVKDIRVTTRDPSYASWLDEVRTQILKYHRFPYSSKYSDRCTSRGNQIRDVDLNADFEYLKAFFSVKLSARRCNSDPLCASFVRGNGDVNCKYDEVEQWTPWFNGDPTKFPESGGIGIEGGCLGYQTTQEGFYDDQNLDNGCVTGYGPYTLTEWAAVLNYQNSQRTVWPNLADPLPLFGAGDYLPSTMDGSLTLDDLKAKIRCRIPWSQSQARSTGFCGGFGNAETTLVDFNFETLTFVDEYSVSRKRRCTSLVIESQMFVLANETQDLRIFSYYGVDNSSSLLTYIYGSLFFDNQALQYQSTPSPSIIAYDAFEIKCNDITAAYQEHYSVENTNTWESEDFFLSRLLPF